MPIGAVIGAGAVLGSAVIGSNAASSAARSSATASKRALQVQVKQFNEATANNKPFLTTGTSALNRIAQMYGLDQAATPTTAQGSHGPQVMPEAPGPSGVDPNATFYQSPDYQFTRAQGLAGIDAGAASRGALDSGATRKAEIAYAGNLANSQYQSYSARLMDLARVGQSAANSQTAAGANYANSYGSTITNAADNAGAAAIAQGKIWSGALNNVAGQFSSSYKAPTLNAPYSANYDPVFSQTGPNFTPVFPGGL